MFGYNGFVGNGKYMLILLLDKRREYTFSVVKTDNEFVWYTTFIEESLREAKNKIKEVHQFSGDITLRGFYQDSYEDIIPHSRIIYQGLKDPDLQPNNIPPYCTPDALSTEQMEEQYNKFKALGLNYCDHFPLLIELRKKSAEKFKSK